jgi:biofilm protein TabA
MIVGLLSEVGRLRNVLPPAIVRGIEALQEVDLVSLETGRHDLEGDDLFYVVQNAVPRTVEEIRPEAHFVYTDIHITISASERYSFSLPEAGLATTEKPVAGSDVAYYPAPTNESFFKLDPGAFVVFWPGELHRTCLALNDKAIFRKVVIKVHSRLLGL